MISHSERKNASKLLKSNIDSIIDVGYLHTDKIIRTNEIQFLQHMWLTVTQQGCDSIRIFIALCKSRTKFKSNCFNGSIKP